MSCAVGLVQRRASPIIANGTPTMLERRTSRQRLTLGADKAYDVTDFVGALRARKVTPHIAVKGTISKTGKRRKTAIDGQTTRHPGYEISLRYRTCIEEIFGWARANARLAKFKVKGPDRTTAIFTVLSAACDIVRLPKLLAQQPA